MEVRPGYAQTVVGVIPKEWNVKTIQQLINEGFIVGHLDGNHGELYPRSHEFKDYGVAYIGANDFANGNVSFDRCKFLSPGRADQFRKGIAKDGDVLFAHNATVGPVALLRTREPYVILSTTATYFRCDLDKLSNVYLSAVLQSQHFVHQYQAVMAQSTRFQVPITTQRKLAIVVPPLPEQRAIATALTDVDELLSGLDRLIEKKRDLKHAAMQQLLTGQTRLLGFHGEWEVKRLGDLAEIVNGGTPKTTEPAYWNGGIRWCTPTDITGCRGKYLGDTERTISQLGLQNSGARLLPAGALLLCSRATIGEVKIASGEVCTNQGFKSLVCPPGLSSEFLYYKLLTMKQQMLGRAFGSTFLEISKANLAALEVCKPPLPEQAAIAAVLSDMDAELAALEARRDKTHALKQAMMQELLTGKTRLVPVGGAHA